MFGNRVEHKACNLYCMITWVRTFVLQLTSNLGKATQYYDMLTIIRVFSKYL